MTMILAMLATFFLMGLVMCAFMLHPIAVILIGAALVIIMYFPGYIIGIIITIILVVMLGFALSGMS